MASKSSSIISIFRRLCIKNATEPFQPLFASAFIAGIHTTPVPKWTICDNVLPRIVGPGNFWLESPANNRRNYARKPVSESEDDEDVDLEDELDDAVVSDDFDGEIDDDDDEVSEFDDTQSDED